MICIAACCIQLLFWQFFSPFIWFLFYPATFFSAWVGGWKVGIVATILNLLLVIFFFIEPIYSFQIDNLTVLNSIAVFFAMGLFFSYIHESIKRQEKRLTDIADALSSANTQLSQANSENKKLLNQAEMLNEQKSAFFTKISQELLTPLTLIQSPIKTLKTELALSERDASLIQVVERNTKILQQRVAELLAVASMENESVSLQVARIDICKLIDDITRCFLHEITERRIVFTVQQSEPILCMIDPQKISRVIFNLFANTVHFTPDEGIITIHVFRADGRVVIHIADSGNAIPLDLGVVLFEKFQATDSRSERFSESVGLHFVIVKEYLALHGGTVGVEISEYGGVQFNVEIPIQSYDNMTTASEGDINNVLPAFTFESELQRSAAKTVLSNEPAVYSQNVVLIVSSNADMAGYLATVLQSSMTIHVARDGSEAFEKANRFKPDIIIIDIELPVLDGMVLAHSIRQQSFLSDTPMLFIAVSDADFYEQEIVESGMVGVLCKPFEPSELMMKIKGLLQLSERKIKTASSLTGLLSLIVDSINEPIFVKDKEGRIEFANKAACQLFNLESSSFVNSSIPESVRQTNFGLTQLQLTDTQVMQSAKPSIIEEEIITSQGPKVLLSNRIPRIDDEGQIIGLVAISIDVTGFKNTTTQLRLALQGKEAAMNELMHRSNNNMQIISSILNLYGISPAYKLSHPLVAEIDNRIKVLSLLHQKLADQNNLNRVNLSDYFTSILQLVKKQYKVNESKIQINCDFHGVSTLIDYAAPCGLLFFELTSNICRHAYPESKDGGKVFLSLIRLSNDNIRMVIKDEGVGLPSGMEIEDFSGMGLSLVHAIAKDQLRGELSITSQNGVLITLNFSDNQYKGRV